MVGMGPMEGCSDMAGTDWTQLSINTIRTLSMDAVQQANSGHPGTPMSLAPAAYQIWQHNLKYDPAAPNWPGRDRFVLSVGHASMLLYSVLHLTGVKQCDAKGAPTDELAVSLDEIKRFRQLDSRTPGHPEYHHTSGVETTTGPLGQGCGNSVGMAIAEKWLAARYNKPGYELFGSRVYTLCGDGCMMEGVTAEAASLAGHLKLGNLCWVYDSNHITIEGHTELAYSDDPVKRFTGYGWNVTTVADVNDLTALQKAIDLFRATSDRPTLIVVTSKIGYGAPNKQDTHGAHGEPLGDEEIRLTKKGYGWPENEKFLVPEGVREHFTAGIGARGAKARAEWEALFAKYKAAFPQEAAELTTMLAGELPAGWDKDVPSFPTDAKGIASRDSGGKVLNAIAKNLPWLLGGSADLAPSTKTLLGFEGAGHFSAQTYGGRNMHYGIREHGMTAILNGMALCKLRPYGAGFLIFSDYARGSLRLSALMGVPTINVFTHDSIGVGEDGPTHQPIEQLIGLRSVPGMIVIRPGDANEVAEAWKVTIRQTHHPVSLALSRQPLPTLDRTKFAPASGVAQGGYILADAPGGKPDVILIATGSELHLAALAWEQLTAEGVKARVVSLPSWELFDAQPLEYRNAVLPPSVTKRVAIEQGGVFGWERYTGLTGIIIGMTTFGASAPFKDLQKKFGFTVEHVVKAAKSL
jgi:transketolase